MTDLQELLCDDDFLVSEAAKRISVDNTVHIHALAEIACDKFNFNACIRQMAIWVLSVSGDESTDVILFEIWQDQTDDCRDHAAEAITKRNKSNA